MRNRGNVSNQADLESSGLQRAQRRRVAVDGVRERICGQTQSERHQRHHPLDEDGQRVTTLRITNDGLERWLIDAPVEAVETAEDAPAAAPASTWS